MNIKGSKHLTLGERIAIAELLVQNKSLNEITESINKDARTISKEIKRNRTQTINNRYVFSSTGYPEYCKKIFRFPFVCVACEKKTSCHHKYKFNYDPQYAHKKYELSLRDSQTGLDCSLEEMALMDKTLIAGTKKGQSIQHIIATNPDMIRYSRSSVYRLINEHKTNVSFFDMKLKVMLKPRKNISKLFMLIFILNDKTNDNVTKIFIYFQEILGKTL